MLVKIYTIIALVTFLILLISGSDTDSALVKSSSVFMILVILTRIFALVMDVIKQQPDNDNSKITSP